MAADDSGRRDRTFYRIVRGHTPTARDFYSHRALRPRAGPPVGVAERSWRSVSVYEDFEEALNVARSAPHLGAHIARLEVPAKARIRMQHTPRPSARSHWDLQARPTRLLRLVREVVRVWPRRQVPSEGVE